MRIPLTKWGRREMVLLGVVLCALIAAGIVLRWWVPTAVFALILVWMFSFFRDPERTVPEGEGLLVAPADGKVTAVEEIDDEVLGCRVKRVSIFLSVFNVHINRSPCAGTVTSVTYSPGRKVNAMKADSAQVNESNTVVLACSERDGVRVSVKQIAGLIARRIVCEAREGTMLARAERFGMIKFGSRTDLCVPVDALAEVKVSVGDKVHAGVTVIGVLR